MAKLRAWLQAARPLAFGNIGLPIVFGAALAAHASGGALLWPGLACALVWGALDQLFIVFSNDLADEDIDRIADQGSLVSGGSRVLVEGKISRPSLRRGTVLAASALCAWSIVGSWAFDAWLLPSCAAVAIALAYAYSFPPIAMSYRNGGALLQALGMGIVLPLVGWQLQGAALGELLSASIDGWPLGAWFVPGFALAWCGNWLTAIPDHASDTQGSKQTRPVRVGLERVANESSGLLALLALLIYALAGHLNIIVFWLVIAAWFGLLLANRLRRSRGMFAYCLGALTVSSVLWLALILGLVASA